MIPGSHVDTSKKMEGGGLCAQALWGEAVFTKTTFNEKTSPSSEPLVSEPYLVIVLLRLVGLRDPMDAPCTRGTPAAPP